MLKGASLQEMQRMIGRKLVVHQKYADQSQIIQSKNYLTDGSESRSKSKESHSRDRKKSGAKGSGIGKKKDQKVINL
jgi:hypothetical protein